MLRMFQKNAAVLMLWIVGGAGVGGSGRPQQQTDFGSTPEFWLLLLLIVIFLAILAWWALSRRTPPVIEELPASHATPAAHAPATARTPAPPTPPQTQAVPAALDVEPGETALPTPDTSEIDLAAPPAVLPPEPLGPTPPETEEEPAPADEVAAAPGVIPEPPGEPDDLRRLEGIGPKVEGALHGLGIKTYAQLATADPVVLEQQIRDAGVRVLPGAPETWPEQAALAAKDDWEGFERLTAELKGGRRKK